MDDKVSDIINNIYNLNDLRLELHKTQNKIDHLSCLFEDIVIDYEDNVEELEANINILKKILKEKYE